MTIKESGKVAGITGIVVMLIGFALLMYYVLIEEGTQYGFWVGTFLLIFGFLILIFGLCIRDSKELKEED